MHIQIYSYPHSYPYRYKAIRTDIHPDSCMYGYMTDRNMIYQSVILEPICEKYPQNPLFCPLRYNPCFLFCIVQVVFLYVQLSSLETVSTKTNLPRNSPSPMERVCTGVGKRSQLPFSPARRLYPPRSGEASINL